MEGNSNNPPPPPLGGAPTYQTPPIPTEVPSAVYNDPLTSYTPPPLAAIPLMPPSNGTNSSASTSNNIGSAFNAPPGALPQQQQQPLMNTSTTTPSTTTSGFTAGSSSVANSAGGVSNTNNNNNNGMGVGVGGGNGMGGMLSTSAGQSSFDMLDKDDDSTLRAVEAEVEKEDGLLNIVRGVLEGTSSTAAAESLPPWVARALALYKNVARSGQRVLDRATPHREQRWAAFGGLVVLYLIRVLWWNPGFAIITYGLGIHLLNLVVGIITPKFDPAADAAAAEEEAEENGGGANDLPSLSSDEPRPFIAKLPEFHAWFYAARAVLIANVLVSFEVFNVPVFVPLLVVYFLVLAFSTFSKHLTHMRKWGYRPWDTGKKRYGN